MNKQGIGPILMRGKTPELWLRAFRELNPTVRIIDRGSYLRVEAPDRCILTKEILEKHLGAKIDLHAEINSMMVSFSGKIHFDDEQVIWSDQ